MAPLKTLLVATDFSEDASNGAMEDALAALTAELERESGFAFEPRLARGPVTDALCAAAAGRDLVVVGARGQHPVRDLALGTTAERMVRRSPAPVLVVYGELFAGRR